MIWWIACGEGEQAEAPVPVEPPVQEEPACATSSEVPACEGSEPVTFPDGRPSGYERCDDGRVHRVSSEPAWPTSAFCEGDEDVVACASDAECGPGGACLRYQSGVYPPETTCGCLPTCSTDADCAPDQACVGDDALRLGTGYATCIDVECRTDADCASGLCGVSVDTSGCNARATLRCREATDCCHTGDDCGDGTCEAHWQGGWSCYTDCTFR